MYSSFGKRALDLAIALPILLLTAPLLAIVAVLVRVDSQGPILFLQDRLGRNGSTFRAYKFRTMTDRPRVPNKEIYGRDAEVTRIGYWLRRFKIDELPQLFNVLSGEMSIVGPRPALPRQIEEYDEHSRRRLLVRPGLTGLAQVNGNTYLSWPERWDWDVAYVERLSLGLDVAILLRTIGVVLRGEERFLQRLSKPNGIGT
jgi:undecaprenyl phosphate N,N'-diacetylbacillosamine 1-phosphate transferase